MASVPATCLYVLDLRCANAFTANNGASVTMNCGIAINDTNAAAASITGGATVSATAISIAGNYVVNNGGTISPAPTTGTQTVADPFASVAGPTAGACNYTNYSPGFGTWTLNPGTYCGGITINNGATAAFKRGHLHYQRRRNHLRRRRNHHRQRRDVLPYRNERHIRLREYR